jgi:hypothetical protein
MDSIENKFQRYAFDILQMKFLAPWHQIFWYSDMFCSVSDNSVLVSPLFELSICTVLQHFSDKCCTSCDRANTHKNRFAARGLIQIQWNKQRSSVLKELPTLWLCRIIYVFLPLFPKRIENPAFCDFLWKGNWLGIRKGLKKNTQG